MIEEPFIKLSKESVTASNDELWIYSVIKGFNTDYKLAEVNINMLKRYTGIKSKKKLVTILNELVKKRKMKIYEDMQCKIPVYILNEEIKPNQSLYIFVKECEEKSFILIYYSEIKKIMCSNYSVEKSGLFKQFVSIIDRVNAKPEKYYQIAYPTLDELSQRVGKTVSTVKKYNQSLEEMKLTYSNLYMIDKEIKRKVYARYKYKQDVEDSINLAIHSVSKKINIKRLKKPEVELNNNEVVLKKQNNTFNNKGISNLSETLKKDLKKLHCEINPNVIKIVNKTINKYGEKALRKYIKKVFPVENGVLNNPSGFLVKKIQKGSKELESIANKLKNKEKLMEKERLEFLKEEKFKADNNIKSYIETLEDEITEKEHKEYLNSGYNGSFEEYTNSKKQERLERHRKSENDELVVFNHDFDLEQTLEDWLKDNGDVENL